MRRDMRALGAILGLAAMPLLLACSDSVTGVEEKGPETRPQAPVASLTVVPSTLELEMGETVWLTAIVKDPAGEELEGEQSVRWVSSNPELVQVSDGTERALVRAIAPGKVTIRARYGQISGSARVRVIVSGGDLRDDDDDEVERDRLRRETEK